jgi:diguanylate cyclase (GGDEF)-like protein
LAAAVRGGKSSRKYPAGRINFELNSDGYCVSAMQGTFNSIWLLPLCCALIACAFWLVWEYQGRRGSSGFACAGFGFLTLVGALDLSRALLPAVLVMLLTPGQWAASALLAQAFLQRVSETMPWRRMAAAGTVPLGIHLYFFAIAPDLPIRNFNSAITCFAIVATALLRLRAHRRDPLDKAIFVTLVVVAAGYLLRPLTWLYGPAAPSGDWLWSIPMLTLYFANVLAMLAMALLLMLAIGKDLIAVQADATRRDALTGIGNRRMLDDAVRSDGAGRERYGAALMVDLDHFKSINDRFGHPAGDAVLIAVARALAAGPGQHAVLARVGGEEFALLIPADQCAAATTLALMAQATIATITCPGVDAALTASAGLALRLPGEALGETLRRADFALYRAKSEGRNRLVRALDGAELASAA